MTIKYTGEVLIGDTKYRWNVKRVARATESDGLTGVSLYVVLEEGPGRDLILDFPYGELGTTEGTKDHSAIVSALRECVPLALKSGWNPLQRGKPLRVDVTTLRESQGTDDSH
jgi:hypothetical protein